MTKTLTVGDLIHGDKFNDPGLKRLKAAIEADARKRAESDRLHPLKDYPYAPMRHSINPTA